MQSVNRYHAGDKTHLALHCVVAWPPYQLRLDTGFPPSAMAVQSNEGPYHADITVEGVLFRVFHAQTVLLFGAELGRSRRAQASLGT
jgi:hypothetical protein